MAQMSTARAARYGQGAGGGPSAPIQHRAASGLTSPEGQSRASAGVSGTMRQRHQCQGRRRLRRRATTPVWRQRCHARRLTEPPVLHASVICPKRPGSVSLALRPHTLPAGGDDGTFGRLSCHGGWEGPQRGQPSVWALRGRKGSGKPLAHAGNRPGLRAEICILRLTRLTLALQTRQSRGRLSYGKPAFIVAALRSRRQKTVPAARARKQ